MCVDISAQTPLPRVLMMCVDISAQTPLPRVLMKCGEKGQLTQTSLLKVGKSFNFNRITPVFSNYIYEQDNVIFFQTKTLNSRLSNCFSLNRVYFYYFSSNLFPFCRKTFLKNVAFSKSLSFFFTRVDFFRDARCRLAILRQSARRDVASISQRLLFPFVCWKVAATERRLPQGWNPIAPLLFLCLNTSYRFCAYNLICSLVCKKKTKSALEK